MKTKDKLNKEWQRMSIADQFDGKLPPRICKELPECVWPNLQDQRAIEKSYFIYGAAGTGKTMYAAALAREVLRRNYLAGNCLTVEFITFDDILLEIRGSFNRAAAVSENEIINKYRQTDWLVLDDFGVNKQTDWTYQVLYSIINYRYEHLKPIIITSNFSLIDMAAKMEDDRVISRLAVMCESVEMRKPKRRKRL